MKQICDHAFINKYLNLVKHLVILILKWFILFAIHKINSVVVKFQQMTLEDHCKTVLIISEKKSQFRKFGIPTQLCCFYVN